MADDDRPLLGNLVESDEPWSLEETQKRIENLLNKRVKSGSFDSKNLVIIAKNMSILAGSSKTAKNIEQELKKVHKEGVKESSLAQKIYDHQKQRGKKDAAYQKDMSSKAAQEILKGAGGGITGTINSLDAGISKVISNFDSFDASVSGLGKALTVIPLLGGTIGALVGWLGNQIDSYRELIAVGQTFGGNMLSLNYAARDAAMNVEEFGKFIVKYSKLSAKISAQGLASITKDVRMTTRQFAHFGLSVEKANDFIATYTQQQVLQGRFEKMDDDTRRIKTANYMRQLTELAKITGKTVDQLNEERTALAENVDKYAIFGEMLGEERKRFEANFDVFEAGLAILPKEIQQPLQQTALMFQRRGQIVDTEIGQLMANLGIGVTDSFENLMAVMNAGDPAQTKEAMTDFVMSLANTGKSTEDMADLTAFMFEGNVEEARKFVAAIQQMQRASLDNREVVENSMAAIEKETELKKLAAEAQEKFNEDTKGMLKIQESLKAAYGEIVKALVEAVGPALTGMGGAIGEFSEMIIDWIQAGGVKDAMEWLKEMFTDLTTEGSGLRTAIDNIIGVIKFLGDNIGLVVAGFAALIALNIVTMFVGLAKGIKGIIGLAKGGSVAADLIGGGKKGGMLSKLWKGAKGLGKGALRLGGTVAGGLASAAMIGKDVYDVATAKEGEVKKEDIGGIGGGAAGAIIGGILGSVIPGAGTMVGAALGAGIGNWVGEWLGGKMDEADVQAAAISTGVKTKLQTKEDVTAAIKEEGEAATAEPGPGGLTAHELLTQMNEILEKQNEILMGIGNATGSTATNTKNTANALSGFSSINLQG